MSEYNNPKFYYLYDRSQRIDGNDVPWLNLDGSVVYDLRKADVYSEEDADKIISIYNAARKNPPVYKQVTKHPVHRVVRLVQHHVPISKIKKKQPKEGELAYLMCTRDTVGKNASFWKWNSKGYSCDVRLAQVWIYDGEARSRSIDVYVSKAAVDKAIQFRIDIQDLLDKEERNITWVLESSDPFKEERA